MLALPTMLPTPLLSTVLDTFFNTFQAPTVSLMAEPVLSTVAAGLRSALIVDIGWEETVVTAVLEYREVMCRRSIRAGKHLQNEMQKVLAHAPCEADIPTASVKVAAASGTEIGGGLQNSISFEECEEIIERLAWCKPFRADRTAYESTDALSTVKEEDELQPSSANSKAMHDDTISIPLTSTLPPTNLTLLFSSLAEPCETSYFGRSKDEHIFDDEELPIHWLVYTSLLKLPVDQRAMCMARLILTGGGSNLPGLKDRVFDEVQQLIDTRGWSTVKGKAVGKF
jgi:actin-related protein